MNDGFIIIALISIVVILIALIAGLVTFFEKFTEDIRYICYRKDFADSYEEYRQWRGELRCRYLMLIPFVNGKNVMRVYHRIFHRKDGAEQEERKDSLALLLMPSLLGICVCIICVCGMTWAWYSASIQAPAQKMTAAYYEVTVKDIVDDKNQKIVSPTGDYELTSDVKYTVTLEARGSVKDCGGYCLVESKSNSNVKYYTQTIMPGDSKEFIIVVEEKGTYNFIGMWGSFSNTDENIKYIKLNTQEEAPINETPKVPVQDVPAPVTPKPETPVTDVPVSESPAIDTPVTDSPVPDISVTETPATDSPATEPQAPEAEINH